MRRALCLSVLIVLSSCSEESGADDPRGPRQGEDEPVTRGDAGDEEVSDAESGEDDENMRAEEDAAEASPQPDEEDAGRGESADAGTQADAASHVDAGESVDTADGGAGESDAGEVACIDEQIAQ